MSSTAERLGEFVAPDTSQAERVRIWAIVLHIPKARNAWLDEMVARRVARDIPENRLNLYGAALGNEGVRAIAPYLPPTLESLELYDNRIGAEGARAIAPYLPPTLKELDLRRNALDAEGVRAIAPHLPPTMLQLFLGENAIGAEGARALAPHLRAMHALENLYMGYNRIGVEGARALAPHLRAMRALHRLFLGGNNIGAEGARALVPPLRAMRALKKLVLKENRLGDEGVRVLAPHLRELRALQELDLNYHNHIGDEGASALAQHLPPALHKLGLWHNQIGVEGARALATHLPATVKKVDMHMNATACTGPQLLAHARAYRAWTPVHRAADARDAAEVRRLLANGADPRLRVAATAAARPEMRSALEIVSSSVFPYPLALPVDVSLRAQVRWASKTVRWTRGRHWQCPRDVRLAAQARALMMGGRGIPGGHADVWGLIFAYLTDGEHERRPLGKARRTIRDCCASREAPCAACRLIHYADPTDAERKMKRRKRKAAAVTERKKKEARRS